MSITEHHVKSWREFFGPIQSGHKKHDLRINDRNFKINDRLILEEFDFAQGNYTGRTCTCKITFITSRHQPCAFSSAVLHRDYVILSLEIVK